MSGVPRRVLRLPATLAATLRGTLAATLPASCGHVAATLSDVHAAQERRGPTASALPLLPPHSVEPSQHFVEIKCRRALSQDARQIPREPRLDRTATAFVERERLALLR